MQRLVNITTKASNHVIECVAELLSRCKNGEVVAVTIFEEHPGGTYSVTGSRSVSRHQTAGMLLDAAISRLQTE